MVLHHLMEDIGNWNHISVLYGDMFARSHLMPIWSNWDTAAVTDMVLCFRCSVI